jgi:sarcosine oxidase subunit beta
MTMGRAETAEVVVVGGGIMGCSVAYHLAHRGCRDVVMLERDRLAEASTSLSAGGIRQQFSHPANVRISQESVRVFERFREEFGAEIEFHQVGYLFLATSEAAWADMRAGVEVQRGLQVPVEVLTPGQVVQRWPYLVVDDVVGGTFCPEDGYADPYSVAMAYAAAGRRLGVRIEDKTPVTDVMVEAGKVVGVRTPRGAVWAPVLVNAAGAWAAQVGALAGIDLPIQPYRRQVFVTDAFAPIPKPVPMIIDFDASFYFRGEGPGILMGMTDKDEPPSFNTHVDWGFLEKVVDQAVRRAPVLEDVRILRGWGGLYAITPDDNPILGWVPGVEGLVVVAGFSGHGFQQGPAVGRLMADLILDGQTNLDLHPFRLRRFEGQVVRAERAVV